MNFESALALARHILDASNCSPDEAAGNLVIPEEHRDAVQKKLLEEQTTELTPVTTISSATTLHLKWLAEKERGDWYYWPRLRNYLISHKQWPGDRVRSLDNSSDEVLKHMSPPEVEQFNKRGLVLGYVQSGKTANYTSLIAKSADVGYRLFIVLTGMDNGLRRQTQIRLQQELVGYSSRDKKSVGLPPLGKRWHVFTTDEINGDFQPGNANTASLQGSQPVLLVVKKNGHVLRRILNWLSSTDVNTIRQIPALIIDDEADQASIDTSGSRSTHQQGQQDEYSPTTINKLIRKLLMSFTRVSFVAYTATPFANILIPDDQYNVSEGEDLYPKDFIIDLPKPGGYLGAEELFGRASFTGENSDEDDEGIDVFRQIDKEDVEQLKVNLKVPHSLRCAILDFVLAGSAKVSREKMSGHSVESPSAMLVHITHLVDEHDRIHKIVEDELQNIRDEWRYDDNSDIKDELQQRWASEFVSLIKGAPPSFSVNFEALEDNKHISYFLESIVVRVINSRTEDVLDYEAEPSLKVIVIGGNKLSRGLTIEGLLVSYFTRQSQMPMYDTVMQMARWFGYREAYVDLTRLYMTNDLADMFSHLALVEHRLREDIKLYASQRITPDKVGMRILVHPSMLVTSKAKQQHATIFMTSYSGTIFQTFRFPFFNLEKLAKSSDQNLATTKKFLACLGTPQQGEKYITWENIKWEKIIDFIANIDNTEHQTDLQDVKRYIVNRNQENELVKWKVVISHLRNKDERWGLADWGINIDLNQVSRTLMIKNTQSLGVITDRRDMDDIECIPESPQDGVLFLYPISKYSAPSSDRNLGSRKPIYEDPNHRFARDLIGIAIKFPESEQDRPEEYLHGVAPGWSTDDE